MGRKHDEIVFSLTKEKIIELLAEKLYGEKGSWSPYHEIHRKRLEDINLNLIKQIQLIEGDISLGKLRKSIMENNEEIEKIPINESLEIIKKIEVPMVKGEGKYKVTKGFLDVVVDIKPKINGFFSCYENKEPKQVIIEVKKEEDFKDVGSIIRQLNEYKEYYFLNPTNSEIFDIEGYSRREKTFWVIYSNCIIPKMARQMLEEEGYIVLQESYLKEDGKVEEV